jgi:hypothetical protein
MIETTYEQPAPLAPPVRPWRRALAAVAVLACLPYLVLKLLWLGGSDVGLSDEDMMTDTTMEVANALTLLLSLAGAALAVLLVRRDRLRLPTWVVLPPAFVGTGLLGGILVLLPIQTVLVATGAQAEAEDGPISGWVFTVVYGGFAALGLCLLALLAAYARERWLDADGWRTPMRTWRPVPARARRIAVAHGVFMVAVCATEAALVGSTGTVDGHRVMAVLMATVCLAGLTALALRRPADRSGAVPLVAVFVGSAAVASWGLFFLVILTVSSPLQGDESVPAALPVVEALRALNGALTLVCLARLRPRRAATAGLSRPRSGR